MITALSMLSNPSTLTEHAQWGVMERDASLIRQEGTDMVESGIQMSIL